MDTVGLIMAERISSVDTMSEQNERLLGFSDAVFAIAMTFLALDLGDTPESLGSLAGIRSRSSFGIGYPPMACTSERFWSSHSCGGVTI
jgi:hypothetical protein